MKIAIIGAGASGLLLAGLLSQNNIDYDIYNNGKVGSKLLASGNGRCNISNENIDKKYYHNSPFYDLILPYHKDLLDYFSNIGIYTFTDDEGRMYPYSESSQSVLNAFLEQIDKAIIDCKIKIIKKTNDKYILNDNNIKYDKIVLATGSMASLLKNKQIGYNDYLKSLNVKISNLYPSLCGFVLKDSVKEISGVRCKALVSLYNNKKLIHKEKGEVIFKNEGISGICIMNLSSYYSHLENKDNSYIELDLAPNLNYQNLVCILNPKLLIYVKKNNINIHKFKLNILSTYPFENAQVISGGIVYEEFNKNLSLKKDNNIYATGELLDIDGICGGYNLTSAFCSALVVFRSIKNEI